MQVAMYLMMQQDNECGISSRTMRTAKSRIGDRLVTEKDGTAWVCYLRD